jgi:hypothetical protein
VGKEEFCYGEAECACPGCPVKRLSEPDSLGRLGVIRIFRSAGVPSGSVLWGATQDTDSSSLLECEVHPLNPFLR